MDYPVVRSALSDLCGRVLAVSERATAYVRLEIIRDGGDPAKLKVLIQARACSNEQPRKDAVHSREEIASKLSHSSRPEHRQQRDRCNHLTVIG